MPDTYYEILDVDSDADTETIRRAYRAKIKEYHPDISSHPDTEEKFKQIQRANDVLTTTKERQRYDSLGHAEYINTRQRSSTQTPSDDTSESEPQETHAEPTDANETSTSGTCTSAESTSPNQTRDSWAWNDPITYAVRSAWQERLFVLTLALGAIAMLFFFHTSTMLEMPPSITTILTHPTIFASPLRTLTTLLVITTITILLHQSTISYSLSRAAFSNTTEPPTLPYIWHSSLLGALLTLRAVAYTYTTPLETPTALFSFLANGPWLTPTLIPTPIVLAVNTLAALLTVLTVTWAVLGGLIWLSMHTWNSYYREGHYIIHVVWELAYIIPILFVLWLVVSDINTVILPFTAAPLKTTGLLVLLPLQPILLGIPYRLRLNIEQHFTETNPD